MNGTTYDLVIAGGGIAGSAIATVMARNGARVLVIEKERTFKDRVRGEFLAPWAMKDLESLGLMDAFLEAGAIALPALAGRTLKPRPVLSREGDPPLSFSHVAVQEQLIGRAAAAGAHVVRGARVNGIDLDGTVSFMTPDGPAEVSARLVVGADGRSSLARKALGRVEETHTSARVLAGVRLQDVPADPSFGYFVIREDAGTLVSLFPQADGFARAYVFQPGADASVYAGPGGFGRFMGALVEHGVPAEAVAGSKAAGPLGAFVADDSFVRRPAEGSLVLVGDSAGISDPTWGQGVALALHDAAVLTGELLLDSDWRRAAQEYAAARDVYYQAIITAEDWLTGLQLTPGAEADARRAHVMAAWKREPAKAMALDLPALGPAIDTSEKNRRWIFDEPELADEGETFIAALVARDFETIEDLVSPGARVRVLLPGGPAEFTGGAEFARVLAGWFGGDGFRMLQTTRGEVADRLAMSWRCEVWWDGEPFPRIVEQHAYAKVAHGQVVVLDLLCSGFRPVVAAA
jgi:2-polyprenyl-6-methoxyphenol hydroxylase-like FAD-dependent oxidoreductase